MPIWLLLVCLLLANPAIAQENQSARATTDLNGVLLIQWFDERRFIYVVDSKNPLRFRTRDGREIAPGPMYTDGGSIPRLFWSFRGFSPWGYAPAYVMHDWLFHQHRCKRDVPPNQYTFEQANLVLDDVIDILFKRKTVEPNETARGLIKWAVDNFGEGAWNEPCDKEPPTFKVLRSSKRPVFTVERLSF